MTFTPPDSLSLPSIAISAGMTAVLSYFGITDEVTGVLATMGVATALGVFIVFTGNHGPDIGVRQKIVRGLRSAILGWLFCLGGLLLYWEEQMDLLVLGVLMALTVIFSHFLLEIAKAWLGRFINKPPPGQSERRSLIPKKH